MPSEQVNFTSVFEKINDLKVLFKFGEKIIPIIQSLVSFMKDIIPLLENINTSIAESTNKMPQATVQISDVTNATEIATTEILDLVDSISNQVNEFEKKVNENEQKAAMQIRLLEKLQSQISGNEGALEIVNELKNMMVDTNHYEYSRKMLNSLREDAYKITLSLQVQDITSQQLAAVNHLIQSVHIKLSRLVDDIENSDIKEEFLSSFNIETVHFDANASYTKGNGRQKEIDEIINQNR